MIDIKILMVLVVDIAKGFDLGMNNGDSLLRIAFWDILDSRTSIGNVFE